MHEKLICSLLKPPNDFERSLAVERYWGIGGAWALLNVLRISRRLSNSPLSPYDLHESIEVWDLPCRQFIFRAKLGHRTLEGRPTRILSKIRSKKVQPK
jgi:hypothetical protein